MTFHKHLTASALAFAMGTGAALADQDGGPQNASNSPGSDASYIQADTVSSSGGVMIPILFLVLVAAAAAN